MDKNDLKEVIHDEINIALEQIANNTKKEKKKPDYLYLVVFSVFMLYLLYMLYDVVKSIH